MSQHMSFNYNVSAGDLTVHFGERLQKNITIIIVMF